MYELVSVVTGSENKPHPYIIFLREVFETPQAYMLIMDFVAGGDLYDLIVSKQRIPERDVLNLTMQLVVGIHYLHSK